MLAAITEVTAATESDPITAILTRDWAALGGWSLFIGLVVFVTIGSFREWWVPGPRYRRLEESAQKQSETLATMVQTLDAQVSVNEILKHFFEDTSPLRREVGDEEVKTGRPPRRSRRFGSTNV